jgi:hypothetical protein
MTLQGLDRPRAGNGRFVRRSDTAKRDAKAAQLRSEGWTLQAIANELGYHSRSAVHDAISRLLSSVTDDSAEALRRRESERLDGLYEEALAVLERTHYAHSQGRMVHDDDGQPIVDDGPKLAALREMRHLRESYRRLHGLDATPSTDVTIRQTPAPASETERQQRMAELVAEMTRRTAEGQLPNAENILGGP